MFVCVCTCVCCTCLCVCLQCGYLRFTSCSVLCRAPHCILSGSSGARPFDHFNELVHPEILSLEWQADTWAFTWVLEVWTHVLTFAGQVLYIYVCVRVWSFRDVCFICLSSCWRTSVLLSRNCRCVGSVIWFSLGWYHCLICSLGGTGVSWAWLSGIEPLLYWVR